LPAEKADELQHHISQCQVCSEYLEALQADDKLLGEFVEAMQSRVARLENNVIEALGLRPSDKTVKTIPIWRTIMKSRITKIAAAAVIVIAILLVLNRFTGSIDGATVAFAKVREAVRNVPWMHISYAGHWGKEMGYDKSDDQRLRLEIWCSFELQIVIYKYADETVTYSDYTTQKIYTYNPVSKRIVTSRLSESSLPLEESSPWGWLQKDIQRMIKWGAEIARKTGRYDGRKAEVYEIAKPAGANVEAINGKMWVDTKTRLPIAKEMRYFHPEGKLRRVVKGTFEYPENGPADIYDVGAPSDAEVVNSLPLPPWKEIKVKYRSYRENGPERFIAIITHALPTLPYVPIEMVDVFYKNEKRWRSEHHLVFKKGPVGTQWRKKGPELGNTFDSLLKWSREYKGESVQGTLYDGNYICSFAREEDGSWRVGEKIRAEGGKMTDWGLEVRDLSWPDIRGAADIVQDAYARENNLIRIEVQGRQFYLNPGRDYICQRREIHGLKVTEFAQTQAGRWYPKTVEDRLTKKTVYLDTEPEFPEGIFELENLPK